jgi:hypothetical protein
MTKKQWETVGTTSVAPGRCAKPAPGAAAGWALSGFFLHAASDLTLAWSRGCPTSRVETAQQDPQHARHDARKISGCRLVLFLFLLALPAG